MIEYESHQECTITAFNVRRAPHGSRAMVEGNSAQSYHDASHNSSSSVGSRISLSGILFADRPRGKPHFATSRSTQIIRTMTQFDGVSFPHILQKGPWLPHGFRESPLLERISSGRHNLSVEIGGCSSGPERFPRRLSVSIAEYPLQYTLSVVIVSGTRQRRVPCFTAAHRHV